MVSAAQMRAMQQGQGQGQQPGTGASASSAGQGQQAGQQGQLEQLLLEQNRLLLAQLQVMQGYAISLHPEMANFDYEDPAGILSKLDPGMRDIFERWRHDSKKLIKGWLTQKHIAIKYEQLQDEGKFHPHLEAERKQKWQFPAEYCQIAQPNDDEVANGMEYDIKKAWEDLRTRHAVEAFAFVVKHQAKCLAMYEGKVSTREMTNSLIAKVKDYCTKNYEQGQDILTAKVKRHAMRFAHLTLREEVPAAKSRIAQDQEKKQKQQEAIDEAQAAYERKDIKSLLAIATFEATKLRGGKGSSKAISSADAIGYLLQQYPDLAKQLKVQVKPSANTIVPAAEGTLLHKLQGKGDGRQPKPKAKAKAKAKPRSTSSRTSQRPRSTSQRRSSSQRPRSTSTKSRASSQSSRRSVRIRSADSQSRKGKGRGKGKGKGKGKGRGYRHKTPAPKK